MALWRTVLIGREDAAAGVIACSFEKPPGFAFTAGQYVFLSLPGLSEQDVRDNRREFSLASAPYEQQLTIATRRGESAFKQYLASGPLELPAELDGPQGSFVLHANSKRPAVMVAGGIGITPMRSMILQAAHDRLPHRLYLFYANPRPEQGAFLDDLWEAESANPNFTFVPIMTRLDPGDAWAGERGHVTAAMISRHVPGLAGAIAYVSGPPRLVADMRTVLIQAGADEDDVRTEEFSGYDGPEAHV